MKVTFVNKLGIHIRMKNLILNIVILLTIISCKTDFSENKQFCDKELTLLTGNSTISVSFSYELNKNDELDYFQSQTETELCNSLIVLNGEFVFSDVDSIKLLIIPDIYCDKVINKNDLPSVLIRSLPIELKKDKIIFDGENILIDSLPNAIAFKIRDFFIKNGYRVIFDLDWDNDVQSIYKQTVIKHIINGYLQSMNEYANSRFNKDLCSLDDEIIETISKNYKLMFKLTSDYYPAPPLPPEKPDFIEVTE